MRDFWLGADERTKKLLSSYASFFEGVVEEVGSGANAGMVKVRRPTEATALADLPWAMVYGSMPIVGAVVLTLVSFTGGRRVITGGTSSGVTDHGALTGLLDDDHTLYYNQTRGDARYSQLEHTHQAIGAFSATVSVSQTDIADQTFTKVDYPVEEFDVSGWYDTTNSRYTPQEEGYYSFAASAGITPAVDGKRWLVTLYKNGARAKDFVQAHTASTTRIAASGAVGRIYANGSTDYFEVYCWHEFGVGTSDLLSVTASMYFTGGYEGSV